MVKRTIQSVYDDLTGRELAAAELLDQPEDALHLLRRDITARHLDGRDRYLCPKCKGPIWPSLRRGRFFNHYAPADPECEWYTGRPVPLSELDRARFLFVGESPLHRRLVRFLHEQTESDPRFLWSRRDRERITDNETGTWRKPDVWAMFHDREIVLELQLSRTYLKDIVGREVFYRKRKIFMLWVFHEFEQFKELAAAKDIYYANRGNALELDREAEKQSLNSGRLKLRAHWQGYEPDASGVMQSGWHSQMVDLDDLTWDTVTRKPYLVDPLEREVAFLRERHGSWLGLFEETWLTPRNDHDLWRHRALRKAWARFEDFFRHRKIPSLRDAEACDFVSVLDQLFAVRNGQRHFGRQTLLEATNTLLEHRRGFTDALIGVSLAYGQAELLQVKSVAGKIRRNLAKDVSAPLEEQDHAFDPVIRFVFPEAARFLWSEGSAVFE